MHHPGAERGWHVAVGLRRMTGTRTVRIWWAALVIASVAGGLASEAVAATGDGTAQPALRQTSPEPPVPVAVEARVERSGADTQLVFDLSRPATVRSYTLENPDRIVLETSEINFQIPPASGRAVAKGGVIRSFRFGHFAPGKSRIVIDLATPARIEKVDVGQIAKGDPSRLLVQLARCDRAAFHQAAGLVQPTDAPAALLTTSAPEVGESRPVIVLDPGHGGIDPGASGVGGSVEKAIVFDFATALADKLQSGGRYKVVLTRPGDTFVSLGDRVKIAREAKAALFVSLHADTLSHDRDVTGATVYTASDKASDAEAARVADTENRADEVAGVDSSADVGDVSDILFDLTRRETRTFSHAYQHTLASYLRTVGRLNRNPERSAGFRVLQAPDIPSVLLELGYLSNEKDVAALTSAEWRGSAAASIAQSIDAFFAARGRVQDAGAAPDAFEGSDPDKTAVVVLRPHL